MSDLTAKFSALEGQIDEDATEAQSQRASIITTLEDIQAGLASVNSDLLLMRSALLLAIGQNNPCADCPTPSIEVPTIPVTTRPIDVDKCKRTRAFLHAIDVILGGFNTLMSYNVSATYTLISDTIGQVIGSLVGDDPIPLPSFPEAVNMAGNYFSAAAGYIADPSDIVSDWNTIRDDMVHAIYTAGNAAADQTAYNAIVDSSDLPFYAKNLIKSSAFNALWAYFFDPASSPDVSAYSGTDCGDIGCFTFNTSEMLEVSGEFGTGWIPDWSKYGYTPVSLPGQDNPQWVFGDFGAWTYDTTGYTVYKQQQAFPGSGTTAETGTFSTFAGDNWIIFVSSAPFELTFCPD